MASITETVVTNTDLGTDQLTYFHGQKFGIP